jgi:guanidinoacetate N-methyltransferase
MSVARFSENLISVVNRIAPHHAESGLRRTGLDCLAVLEKTLGWPASDPRSSDIVYRDEQLLIDGREVMQAWEEPVMRAMARNITAEHGDVLEIGYGLGISARRILEFGCRSYTVLEPHPIVIERARRWGERQDTPVTTVLGAWPLDADKLGAYDGIFFDPFPQTWNERTDAYLFEQLRHLRAHLRARGVVTYFGRYSSLLPERHQRFLYDMFSEVALELVTGLKPPSGCQYWRANTMLAISCRK